jgi:hypothetical protein
MLVRLYGSGPEGWMATYAKGAKELNTKATAAVHARIAGLHAAAKRAGGSARVSGDAAPAGRGSRI